MTLRAFSFGGGVQSTAALVLAARGEIDFPLFIFANVGDDSEHPATLAYVAQHARPFADARGIEIVEVQKRRRSGEPDTIWEWLDRTERTIGIPMRMANGAPGNRSCTEQFKIGPVRRELKRRGASRTRPAALGLGISADEWHRMRADRLGSITRSEYPLVDLGLNRGDCIGAIGDAGLPVPPKSSCFFCPFHKTSEWQELKRSYPELYRASEALEQRLSERRARLGKDPVYLSYKAVPLARVVGTHDQLDLFEGASCDIAGYCHA